MKLHDTPDTRLTQADFECPPPRRISPAERAQAMDYRPAWYQVAQATPVAPQDDEPPKPPLTWESTRPWRLYAAGMSCLIPGLWVLLS